MFERTEAWLKQRRRVAASALILATFLVYSPSLENGFVFDDEPQILDNPFVLNPELWPRIFTGSVWSFQGAGFHTSFYRPLQFVCYTLIYRLAGPNPAVFHFLQLAFYAVTVLLVYQLGRRLLDNELAALGGALLWAVHPLHVETVAWASALPDVGVGLLSLVALLLFICAERGEISAPCAHALAALVFFAALLFKEVAITLPLLLAAWWLFFGERELLRNRITRLVPYVLVLGVYLMVRVAVLGHVTASARSLRPTIRELGAALGLLGEHARLFFWPSNLSVFRTFDLDMSLRSPWPWAVVLTLLTAFLMRHRERRLTFLAVAWVIPLLPCLDIRQLSLPFVADRFSYLPSVFLCVAVSYLMVSRLPRTLGKSSFTLALVIGLAVLVGLWTAKTLRAIPNWRDNQTLASYSLAQSPDAALVHVIRAEDLQFQEGDLEGAAREFETALRLNASSPRPLAGVTYSCYFGLGHIALQQGREQEALEYFHSATRVLPQRSPAYDALGAYYFPRGDYMKAAEFFAQAVNVNPYDLVARFYLGTCWLKLGKYREAAEQFRTAREIDPSYAQAYEAEARALEAAGDHAGAARARSLMPRE